MVVRIIEGEGDLGIVLTRYEAIVAMHELQERLAVNLIEREAMKHIAPVGIPLHNRHIEQIESVIAKLKAKVG